MHTPPPSPWRLCVAPMMDWTDRHCRYFHRRLSAGARLYTEMVHAHAVLKGDRLRLLGFDPAERPLALQLGGSEPAVLAAAARIGVEYGYDEINLNVGCPSDRVQSGRFGACLMREPARVADCVGAMRAALPVSVPVTVKCRIGVDEQDEEETFAAFVATVAAAGCDTFLVHARKAWLAGLSPKENREIPPLNHARVRRLKREFPALTIVVNGGITTLAQALDQLEHVDGVMLGRAAYHDPYLLARLQQALFEPATPLPARREILLSLEPYARSLIARGERLAHLTRHLVGLWLGQPGARGFRRVLSEAAHRPDADWQVVLRALAEVDGALASAA